jgi:hypothetical protein
MKWYAGEMKFRETLKPERDLNRVTGHNPAAAIYLSQPGGYYHRRLYPPTRLRGSIGERWDDLLEDNEENKSDNNK